MDHNFNSDHLSNAHNTDNSHRDEDQHDAMEVDGEPSMMVDINQSHDHDHDLIQHHDETGSRLVSTPLVAATEQATNEISNEPLLSSNQSQNQSQDLGVIPGASADMARTPTTATREAPAFDEDTERPRQRRRFHVTVEEETDTEVRAGTDVVPTTGPRVDGTTEDDEVAVLVSDPPRLGDLSIASPPIVEGEQAPMLDVVSDSAPIAQDDPPVVSAPHDHGTQSPRINTIPLPDVPPPPAAGQASDPVMEAARRLTTTPDANPDQMQADLALLAPYIAAQAMAAAFPFGGGRPPPGGDLDTGGGPPGQREGAGAATANGGAPPPPPPPFPFGLPFLFGPGSGEMPPDHKRAERLANGLKVVEDGLLKRWKAVCGEEGAVCAVCYSELLEEPGIEKEKEEDKGKGVEVEPEVNEKSTEEEDAHAQALREALKRREQMEKEEKEELEHKLETAVLVFPCGHAFHRTCLLPWLSRHTTCPACRFDIDPKSDTLNLPVDNGNPFGLGLNGFNFGDFFTVGPVLRVPRDQAPGPRPQRWPGRPNANPDPNPNPNPIPNLNAPPGARGPHGAQTEDVPPPSMTELLDQLFGPLLRSTAFPPLPTDPALPSSPPSARRTRPARENAEPPVPTPTPSAATAATNPANSSSSQDLPSSPPAPVVQNANPSPTRASDTRRRENSDRPVAMFGRLTPRRAPQPITPAWMRSSAAPPAASSSTTPTASQPASAAPSSSEPGPSTASEPTSEPPTPVSAPPEENNRASFGQLRSMVANLLPHRLSHTGRATADAPPIPSNHSHESSSSASTTRNNPRATLRAMLRESTARFRDFAGNRRSSRGSSDQPGASTATAPVHQAGDDDMPALESESDDGSDFSEDAAHESDEDDIDEDMPGLEPINDPLPLPIGRQNELPPSEDGDGASQEDDDERPLFGPPRPPGQDMMDNIITLRIDLGHADGRDETIIVPLLFNPIGRPGQPRASDAPAPAAPPVPPRPRATPPPPPPMKKWTPPEAIKTFRQVVEEKEREAGWRCDDPLCLLGPVDDEEPAEEHTIVPRYPLMRTEGPQEPVRYKVEDGIRVYAGGEDVRVKAENPVCDHTLHAECLVKSARINGFGPEHNSARNAPVTLKCPMCRTVGNVDRQVWDEGVKAEEAGEQLE